ncbi:hypothetical protein [Streptomyces sp. BE230]|uniref:hypothetical protein n=1 Tax=Streptomyces sp. BE230 TaxID=3002526 RepID=UPI002ED02674|nr:hypothetical protein [Streptomyces sp. BE230]
MNARRVIAAAGVIHAAQKTRQTAAGIAASLEAAGLLQSPETAAEQLALLAEVGRLRRQVADAGPCDGFTDEDDDSHETKVAAYLSTPYTDDFASPEDPHDSPLHQSYATPRDLPPQRLPGICPTCGDIPAAWCPDCAACRRGCDGGHDDNPCTHPNAPWTPSPVQSGGAQ